MIAKNKNYFSYKSMLINLKDKNHFTNNKSHEDKIFFNNNSRDTPILLSNEHYNYKITNLFCFILFF